MPTEDGKLTDEEYAALSPSDKAHYDVKGRLGDGFDPEDTEATKAAVKAAFGERDEDTDEDEADDDRDPTATGTEAAGVGAGEGPQTTSEATEAEQRRREEMSDVEKDEAEARDRLAADLEPDDYPDSEVPNVGSPDVEGREDSNDDTVLEPGETKGTEQDERTSP